ncbi:hypothetical protein G7Z17_g1022 [Cylindrodendrum hubeiense]|uniref:PNPLA domain-containing protein n=1 Tax=Cylindrodendrum hubeiense TaxID=595255 RepID=A0A9P5HLP3_9HYPO|nr:hypothetical protein G7Z17_g1022 [Cylindrodendrum hubeiense]
MHDKGHQFNRPKQTQADSDSVDDVEEDSHVCTWDMERFHDMLWEELRRSKNLDTAKRRLAALAKETEIIDVRSQRTCLTCLSHCPTNMLPCKDGNHGICRVCLHHFADLVDHTPILRLHRCPLGCAFTTGPWSIRVKPKTAGPRVLVLDGGGGVRGVVELAILNRIQKEVGIRIDELFDLVVGTSTGGIVALGVFHKGWDPKKSISTFQKLAHSAFSLRMRLGTPVIKSLVQPFCSYRYTSASVEQALKQHFGKEPYLFGPSTESNKREDWVKVGVVTCLQSKNDPSLIANYSRDPSGNSEDHQSKDFKVWEAATTAAPFYFQPFTHHGGTYEDGAIANSNPIRVAFAECNKIWPGSVQADILVSIGTGLVVDGAGRPKTRNEPGTERLISLLPGVIRKQVETSHNTISSTTACEDAWRDFMKDIQDPRLRRNCHRLNVALPRGVKFDDVKHMSSLNKASKDYLSHGIKGPYFDKRFRSLNEHVRAVARRLVASLFYFSEELSDQMHDGERRGLIFCRLDPGSQYAQQLFKSAIRFRLLQEPTSSTSTTSKVAPVVFCQGRRRRFDPQGMAAYVKFQVASGSFRRIIQLHSPEWKGKEEYWEPISGF